MSTVRTYLRAIAPITESEPGLIVSTGFAVIRPEDDLTTGYAAYAQSKLAQVMHAMTLADRHEPSKLLAYSLHPGVVATKLLRQGFGPVQGMATDSGAKTSVKLAGGVAEDEPSGSYYSDGVATPPSSIARDADARTKLWDLSVQLAKVG